MSERLRPSRVLATVWETLRGEPILVGLLVFAALFFLYRWGIDVRRPGGEEDPGWRGYHDQGFYLLEAQYLAQLDPIPRAVFSYGPAYPALAAPFVAIDSYGWPFGDPFLPANAAIWLLAIAATYLTGRRLLGEAAGLAAALALMLATPLVRMMTVPWNSTVCLGAVAVTMLVALRRRLGPGAGALLGLAIGFAYAARYVDALWITTIAVAILLARFERGANGVRVIAGLVAGALIPLAPTFYLHWRVFGSPFTTMYSVPKEGIGNYFSIGDIPSHGFQTFVTPYFFNDEPTTAEPLLSSMFLLLLAPVGAWALFVSASRAGRTLVMGYTIASVVATVFYLAWYFTGSLGMPYGALHFFKMWFPLWTLAGVAAIVALARRVQRAPT